MLQCSINHINLLRSLLPCSFTLNRDGYQLLTVLVVGVLCQLQSLATMLLQAQLMVTEDGMEFRWHKSHTWRVCSTLWALSETRSIKTACSAKKHFESRNLFFLSSPKSKIDSGFSMSYILSVSRLITSCFETETSTTTRNS